MSDLADNAPLAPETPLPATNSRLRGAPPRVMRLSRKSLAVVGVVAGAGIGGSLIYALKPAHQQAAKELYTTDGRTKADVLAAAPKDYGQVPKLGPPLPGDLGRPIISAEQRGIDGAPPPIGPGAGSLSPNTTITPAAQAAQAARQRVAQERDSARTSKLFLGAGAPGGAETSSPSPGLLATAPPVTGPSADGSTPQSPQATPTDQAAKRAFLNAQPDRRTAAVDQLAEPPSPYVVQAGSVIPAALITGIRSDLPGQITAQVTENIYDSPTGRILLIPQGSRLIGEYDSQVASGQQRVLLAWTRLILPDGRSIVLERQPGADVAGYGGLQDRVDNHWGRLFTAAILSTMLSVGSEAGTSQDENDLAQAIRSGAANSFSQTGQLIVGRELNIQPTLTIRPGYPLRVIVTRDLVLAPIGQGAR